MRANQNLEPATVNKTELARHLDISLKTLNAWIAKDPAFPIVSGGTHGSEYAFDVGAVERYVAERDRRASKAKAQELTPNQRKVLAQARLCELEIEAKLGELVPLDDIQDLLAEITVALARSFETVAPRLKHELGVEPKVCAAINAWLDGFRLDLTRKMKSLAR